MSEVNITIPGLQEAQDELKIVIRDAISEESKDIRFTKQMIDDLSASDFISILRNEYRNMLEGLERRKQDIEKSKST